MTYIFDSNVLIYLAFKGAKEHTAARNVTDRVFSAQEIVILTEAIVLSFLRISTSLKPTPLTEKEAQKFLDALLDYPNLQLFAPSVRHYKNLTANLVGQKIKGNLVMDAHIIFFYHHEEVWHYRFDSDFQLIFLCSELFPSQVK